MAKTYADFDPAILKRGMTDGTDLKPSLVTDSYSGGTPSSAGDLKSNLVYPDGRLKEGLLDGDELAPGILWGADPYGPEIAIAANITTAAPTNWEESTRTLQVIRDSTPAEDVEIYGLTAGKNYIIQWDERNAVPTYATIDPTLYHWTGSVRTEIGQMSSVSGIEFTAIAVGIQIRQLGNGRAVEWVRFSLKEVL